MEIYTIGHSNMDMKKFITILKENHIEMVVDVRSIPFCKYASHFDKENLQKELEKERIGYLFMGDALGGRPKRIALDEFYSADILSDILYKKIMEQEWYQNGISKLIETASKNRAAIMCSEENPNKCHRNLLVSQTLLERGIDIIHIRADGHTEIAKKHIFQSPLVQFEKSGVLG